MAGITLSGWPAGATVSAYVAPVTPGVTALGSAIAAGVASSGGQVTLAGLQEGVRYVASDGVTRRSFQIATAPEAGGGGGGGGSVPVVFSQTGFAQAQTSGAWVAPGPGTLDQASLTVTDAPVGSPLIVEVLLNEESVLTLVMPAGATSPVLRRIGVEFQAGDRLAVQATSVGSTTPAANVVTVVWASVGEPVLPPLYPDQLEGLTGWLVADDLADGAVAAWTDRSTHGLGCVQATGGLQPVAAAASINGHKAVVFDGVDDKLALGNVANGQVSANNNTLLIVCAIDDTAGQHQIVSGINISYDGTRWSTFAGGTVNAAPSSLPFVPSIISHRMNITLGTDIMRINGALVIGPADFGNSGFGGSGWLGGRTDSTRPLQGRIAEFIHYNRTLNDAELAQIEAYLADRYAITV